MEFEYSFVSKFKPIFYATVSFLFAILIFATQERSAENQAKQLKDAIEKIKPFQVSDINKKTKEWLTIKKEETKFMLFYFPYSFIPGFWVDCNLFNTSLNEDINKIEESDNLFIFLLDLM